MVFSFKLKEPLNLGLLSLDLLKADYLEYSKDLVEVHITVLLATFLTKVTKADVRGTLRFGFTTKSKKSTEESVDGECSETAVMDVGPFCDVEVRR